jgi:hypothetical protein
MRELDSLKRRIFEIYIGTTPDSKSFLITRANLKQNELRLLCSCSLGLNNKDNKVITKERIEQLYSLALGNKDFYQDEIEKISIEELHDLCLNTIEFMGGWKSFNHFKRPESLDVLIERIKKYHDIASKGNDLNLQFNELIKNGLDKEEFKMMCVSTVSFIIEQKNKSIEQRGLLFASGVPFRRNTFWKK